MFIEGVGFNEPLIRQMSKEDFVNAHKDVLWLDRDPAAREKMLSDVYDTITGAKETPEREDPLEGEGSSEPKDGKKAREKKK